MVDTPKMQGLLTRMSCKSKIVEVHEFDMKVNHLKPDSLLMEYKYFLRHLSFFLPTPELRENEHFKLWMRTPGMSDQFATEIEYVLPQPRQSHYQHELKHMRKSITTRLQKIEAILGHYPV